MNERIRELAIKAGLLVETSDGWDICIDDNLEDFAELIIKECAKIASNPAPGCHSSFGKIIKEHFGVEE